MGVAGAAQRRISTEFNVNDGSGEFASYRVGYKSPTGAAFDFGGGAQAPG